MTLFKYILTWMVVMMASMATATTMPIYLENGHIYAYTYTIGMKKVKMLVDTGSETTIVFDEVLLTSKRRCESIINGLSGNTMVKSRGVLTLVGVSTMAYYIDDNTKSYDAILGLDWMLEHKAVIDIQTLTLTYQ